MKTRIYATPAVKRLRHCPVELWVSSLFLIHLTLKLHNFKPQMTKTISIWSNSVAVLEWKRMDIGTCSVERVKRSIKTPFSFLGAHLWLWQMMSIITGSRGEWQHRQQPGLDGGGTLIEQLRHGLPLCQHTWASLVQSANSLHDSWLAV